jgi:alpha-tubulin suppressor-like RCC1 family protein
VTASGIGNAKAIAAGGDQSCAVLADGSVDCWGEMDFIPGHSSPTEVPGITNAKAVTAGYYQACALLTNGHVDCWGVGAGGGLGNASTTNSANPVEVSGITNATQISTGDDFSCALLSTGDVKCWGSNESGQLGVGTESGPEQCGSWGSCSKVPVTVHSLSGASALGAGLRHACAALASGRVMCWGENNAWISGGTQPDALTPVLVP